MARLDVAAATGPAEICIRPEDVRLAKDGAGPIATVRREIPRGHYKQVVVEAGGVELQAFVSGDFTATESRLTFARVLVYQNDQLVEAEGGLSHGGATRHRPSR